MAYLTPDRYRAMGFGIDLTDLEDVDLRATLNRASALVDSYCGVSQMPQKHQFYGGTITGEQHNWRLPADYYSSTDLGSRRVYLYHRPIKTITDFRVKFTNTYDVAISPSNLYINNSEGWAEVVSLAAVVTGIYPVGINFGLYTPVAETSYTYGFEFAVVDEILVDTDAQTFRASNGFWAASPAPKVYINAALQSSGYTVDSVEGTVFFTVAPTATDVITASYTYTLPSAIAEATGMITATLLAERGLQAIGMGGIAVMQVAEVELRRSIPRSMRDVVGEVDPAVAALLAPYVEWTIR